MAVVYESVATATFATLGSGDDLNITKPTGLAVGDYLVAHLSQITDSGDIGNWGTPSGWTSLVNTTQTANANSKVRLTVFYKLATETEVAASSFNFRVTTSPCDCGGALYRISGGTGITASVAVATDTTTPTFTNSIIPPAVNSLLLFLTSVADAGDSSGSCSGYAITTNNPTWTERYDFTVNDATGRGLMAGATASRPETSATGNSTCTYVNYDQNSIGAIVILTPVVNATVTPAVIDLTLSVQSPTVTGGATVTPTVIDLTLSVQAPTVTGEINKYTSLPKSSDDTWTALNKSTT